MTRSRSKTAQSFLTIETLGTMSADRKRRLLLRSVTRMEELRPLVHQIMLNVQRGGDQALLRYTKKFDRVSLNPSSICLSAAEIRQAYTEVHRTDPKLIGAMKETLRSVKKYHEGEKAQLRLGFREWKTGVRDIAWGPGNRKLAVGQVRTPIDRVGIYVPGGRHPLFSTALMAVTPAKVAGVPEIIVASPPTREGDIDPKIVVAADLAGASLIVRAGGAQAIAAMAYGTASVPKVHKIFGPGNIYVAAAKSYVASSGVCAIDFLAGPSEILVIADGSAETEWVARDLVSQAEHDPDACAVLVTTSRKVATAVRTFIGKDRDAKGQSLGVTPTARLSLSKYGAIVLAKDLYEAVSFANDFAPEHLEIMTENPRNWLKRVRNAGSIFLGRWSPVAIGDYVCPNHILPTGGAAKYTSGINIDMFMKKPSVSNAPKELAVTLNRLVQTLSEAEQLYNQHGLSVKARADAVAHSTRRGHRP